MGPRAEFVRFMDCTQVEQRKGEVVDGVFSVPAQEKPSAWGFAEPSTLNSWLSTLPLMIPPSHLSCLEVFLFERAVCVIY